MAQKTLIVVSLFVEHLSYWDIVIIYGTLNIANEQKNFSVPFVISFLRKTQSSSLLPLITNIQLAKRFIEAVYSKPLEKLEIKVLDEY